MTPPPKPVRDQWAAKWKRQGKRYDYRTPCTSAVLNFLGCKFRIAQCVADVVAVARRNGYAVRSRLSRVGRGKSVGQVRRALQAGKLEHGGWYLVRVPGHVLLLAPDGRTVIDTDPRKRDRRIVTHFFHIFPK